MCLLKIKQMNIKILSRNPGLYSTDRLVEAGLQRGHSVEVIDPLKCDLIILEHVLEHVTEPCRTIQNVFKLLNPSGYILITTPFLVKIHNAPQDCTRWTPIGLRNLLINEGFDKNNMVTGQWGNKSCIKANFKHWVKYNPLFHSLKNEEMFPAVVWCLARKS